MKLTVIIPAHDEEEGIHDTVCHLIDVLEREALNFDVLIVNDHSKDQTEKVLKKMSAEYSQVEYINNNYPNGFGFAVRAGLDFYSGDAVTLYMADGSDDPEDVACFFRKLQEGYDCVFGSRFIKGGEVYGYPKFKLVINRLANTFVRLVFAIRYNDATNAFKMYRRETIDGLKPFLSHHFNFTLELPLKSITRGFSYAVLPNSWTNRVTGESKLKLKEMGSRYLFVVIYCLIEKWLLMGDYNKERVRRIHHHS